MGDVLDVGGALGRGHLGEQHVQVLHDAQADLGVAVAEEAVRDRQQVAVGELGAQDPRDLVQAARQRPQRLNVRHARQLHVQRAELVPFGLAGDPDERGEVEGGVVADILVVCLHGCIDEKVCNSLVNRGCVLQSRYEGSYVLEGRPTDNLGGRVKQEAIVKFLEALRVAVHGCDFGDLGDDVGARFSHFPLLVLRQAVIQREKLLAEHVSRDVLRHVGQVLGQRAADTGLFVEAHGTELVHNIALVDLLAHVTTDLVQKLDGGLAQFVILVVRQVQRKPHNMLLPVLLHDRANLGHNLDRPIPHILLLVVKQAVEQREHSATNLLVTHLPEILRDQGDQRRELVQQGLLDVGKLVLGELLERRQQDVDLSLVFLVGEGEQVVRKVLPLHLRVALDQREDLLRTHNIRAAVRLLITILVVRLDLVEQKVDLGVRFLLFLLGEGALLQLLKDAIGVLRLRRQHIIVNQSIIKLPVLFAAHDVEAGLVVGLVLAVGLEDELVHLRHVVLVHIVTFQGARNCDIRVVSGVARSAIIYDNRAKMQSNRVNVER